MVTKIKGLGEENMKMRIELGRTGDPKVDAVMRTARELRGGARQMVADPAAARPGESHGESLLRRHKEHSAGMRLEGKPALKFTEWCAADRIVNVSTHAMAETEKEAPRRALEEQKAKVLGELDEAAANLMLSEEKFRDKPGAAKNEILKRNPELSAKYRSAFVAGVKPEQAKQ
jgi:hypothetical protein